MLMTCTIFVSAHSFVGTVGGVYRFLLSLNVLVECFLLVEMEFLNACVVLYFLTKHRSVVEWTRCLWSAACLDLQIRSDSDVDCGGFREEEGGIYVSIC